MSSLKKKKSTCRKCIHKNILFPNGPKVPNIFSCIFIKFPYFPKIPLLFKLFPKIQKCPQFLSLCKCPHFRICLSLFLIFIKYPYISFQSLFSKNVQNVPKYPHFLTLFLLSKNVIFQKYPYKSLKKCIYFPKLSLWSKNVLTSLICMKQM